MGRYKFIFFTLGFFMKKFQECEYTYLGWLLFHALKQSREKRLCLFGPEKYRVLQKCLFFFWNPRSIFLGAPVNSCKILPVILPFILFFAFRLLLRQFFFDNLGLRHNINNWVR